ncbi:MAG: RNA polymerase factor sigma-54 [Proteobacteria bacterium]|nr:RNA polymerase factor sigma-54 [Pseudomonadota bacterium]
MKPSLSLRVSQHLALTPQLQQSIRLLQLSTLELANEVEQMLDDNPFLEREGDELARDEFGLSHANSPVAETERDADNTTESIAGSEDSTPAESLSEPEFSTPDSWDGDGGVEVAADDAEWGGDAPPRGAGADTDDELDPGARVGEHLSLTDHLHRQALALRLSPEDQAALRFLIESLNDDGYLEDSLAQLVATLTEEGDDDEQVELLLQRFTLGLKLLQSLEPPGVGARDLVECLCLQLRARRAAPAPALDAAEALRIDTALALCAQHGALELLARRDARKLAQLAGVPEDGARAAMALIGRLEPKPGRPFADVRRQLVVPDVIVSAVGGPAAPRFRVRINPDVMPRLRVHEAYAGALRGGKGGDNHAALAQRVQEARWFIRNIQQRFDTILRVASLIVERQRGFFVHGDLAMRPMVQRELADELGVHESTISRVTTAKYMATPRGTYELKYFFGSALGTEAGGNASSTAVRALIKQFVAAESAAKPLSDSQLADMLKEQGIDCARRTVAKYREGLRIPVAALRKAA